MGECNAFRSCHGQVSVQRSKDTQATECTSLKDTGQCNIAATRPFSLAGKTTRRLAAVCGRRVDLCIPWVPPYKAAHRDRKVINRGTGFTWKCDESNAKQLEISRGTHIHGFAWDTCKGSANLKPTVPYSNHTTNLAPNATAAGRRGHSQAWPSQAHSFPEAVRLMQ